MKQPISTCATAQARRLPLDPGSAPGQLPSRVPVGRLRHQISTWPSGSPGQRNRQRARPRRGTSPLHIWRLVCRVTPPPSHSGQGTSGLCSMACRPLAFAATPRPQAKLPSLRMQLAPFTVSYVPSQAFQDPSVSLSLPVPNKSWLPKHGACAPTGQHDHGQLHCLLR